MPRRVLDRAQGVALVRGGAHHVDPVLAGDQRPSNGCSSGPAPVGRRAEVVDGDLEDVVVDREQVVDRLELRVVRRGLVEERVVGPLDVGGALAAQDRAQVQVVGRPDRLDGLPRGAQVEAVRADLLVVLHDVGAVLRDVDQLVAAELAAQGGVLPAARRAQQDLAAVQLVEQRPEVVVDALLVVEQGAVHVDGDEPDVGDGVEDEEVPRGDLLRRPRGPGARPSRSARVRPVSTSARLTSSSGWWLMPSGLRRNSMPTPVTAPIAMASCPARLNSAGTCRRPVSSIPARTTSCRRVSHMTAGASCSSRADQVSPRRPAISSSSRVMLPQTRSRSSSCSPRRSTVSRASPGTTLTAPGNVSSRPTVPMMWCSARHSRSTASATSLAPSRASCRFSYRAPPACRASPSICTANRRALAIEVTTPSGAPPSSSSGPCSMCASR